MYFPNCLKGPQLKLKVLVQGNSSSGLLASVMKGANSSFQPAPIWQMQKGQESLCTATFLLLSLKPCVTCVHLFLH